MISHANLNSGQTAGYYQKDDYYKSQDEGVWMGRLAQEKRLAGEIRQEDFNAQIQERGTRQGYEIHLGYEKTFDHKTPEAQDAHGKALERVKEYLSGPEIQRAGKLHEEATRNGTSLRLVNVALVAPEGIRKFDPNESFSLHRERIEQVYREAVREQTGRDVGKVEVRDRAVPQVAYDFTVSAPKSVSIAMAQGGQVEKDLRECHAKAVDATLKYLETYVDAQKKVNGVVTRERTGNMVCGRFTHEVNRNQEPNLHDHLVIFNRTKCSDGRERAIDNRSLVENKYHFDLVYKTELAKLAQEKGYEVKADHQKGTFELKGISREMIETFSSRRMEIVRKIEGWGKDPAQANRDIRDAACQLTRDAKRSCDKDMLRASWRETMKENQVPEIVSRGRPIERDKEPAEIFRATERNISGRTVAFTRKEFLDEAMKRGMGQWVTLPEAKAHFEGLVRERGITRMGEINGKEYFATRESLETEQAIFRHVEEGKGAVRGLDGAAVEKRLEGGARTPEGAILHLSEEQKNAVRHITTTTDRFSAVQGLAGTGKTTMLNQAREIYQAQGYTVKGVCFTGKAAEGLEKEAGIDSKTIHGHLNALEKEAGRSHDRTLTLEQRDREGWKLDGLKPEGKEVWIVDEASMVDNRLMRQVQEAAILKDAKVVFAGDAKQLQPIGAGNAFTNLVERHKIAYAEMKDIQRQKDPNLREAVRETARGDVSKALDRLKGNIVQVEGRPDRINRIAEDYSALAKTARRETVIVTGTNSDRREINEKVRGHLKARGELEGGRQYRTAQGAREFAPGDKVIFLKNDRELMVKNGQVGVVRVVEDGRLLVQAGDRLKTVDLARYNHLDHGYTLTAHKAQGITADRALIHLDSQQKGVNNRNAFYVDVSRARHEVKIYTDDRERVASAVGRWQTKLSGDDFQLERERNQGEDLRRDRREPELAPEGGKEVSGRAAELVLEKTLEPGREEPIKFERAEIELAGREDIAYQPGEREVERQFTREWQRDLDHGPSLERSLGR